MKLSIPLRAYRRRHHRLDPTGIGDEANEVLVDARDTIPGGGSDEALADLIPDQRRIGRR